MDLVSSTLDKYLKHRFNGNGLERVSGNGSTKHQAAPTTTTTTATITTTGGDDIQMIVSSPTNVNNFVEPKSSLLADNNSPTNNLVSTLINETSNSSNLNTVTEDLTHSFPSLLSASSLEQKNQNQILDSPKNINHIVSNGTEDCDNELPKIHIISISNIQPCCLALRTDLSYIAAGFENSHIYLWNIEKDATQLNIGTMFTLLAHSGAVYHIEFVSNNDLMLSCSEDTTIRLWCLNTKCNVTVYRGHNYPIWSLDIGPQGNLFASASMDATARLWRLDKITPLRIFCGHDDDVECVKFHPNEKYIATGSSDATVRLWSVSDGKMVRLMVGHQNPIISLSFLPNGKFLASASRDGIVKVWNLATNIVTSELSVPASQTISFSMDQEFLSSCGVDNVLRLWQVDGSNLIEKKELEYNAQSSTLIQSHFHRENELYVIRYLNDEKTKK